MRRLKISGKTGKGKYAEVDDEDYLSLKNYRWHLVGGRYIARGIMTDGKQTRLYLHHAILGKKEGMDVDHINGNKLDNTRKNLRFVTHHQNTLNRKTPSNNTTGYRGVTYHKKDKKYQAAISKKGKTVYLGQFKTSKEASLIYNQARMEYTYSVYGAAQKESS